MSTRRPPGPTPGPPIFGRGPPLRAPRPPDPTVEGAPLQHDLASAIAEVWPRAQAHWSAFLLLSPPVDGSTDPEQKMPSVAQIDLASRQVHIHVPRIVENGLLGSLEAILAHEVGHHVRYPANLSVDARLRLLERPLLPLPGYSTTNLFTDLLINQHLAASAPPLRPQLAAVYRAFVDGKSWGKDPAFAFYLAIYEELWGLDRGDLLGPAHAAFESAYPRARADAQLVAQNLFALGPNLYTQFLYFVSVVSRYVRPREGDFPSSLSPYSCARRDPSPEDWADALLPGQREREAVERALEEGWISTDDARQLIDEDSLEGRIHSLPGTGTANAELVPQVMAAWYRREAEKYLFKPEPLPLVGEAVVPTTLDEWEAGDPVQGIDWMQTLVERGPVLGRAAPLRRDRIADHEGHDVPLWQPRIELYLDVSGSMPDPRRTLNAMTLAAQILVVAAVRAGGWARAAMYSSDTVKYWTFCRSEMEMSRFLMHYIGGGTQFPFALLDESVGECGRDQPIRVVLSDSDFHANYDADRDAPRIVRDAAARSPHFVFLHHGERSKETARYEAVGARVIAVDDLDHFPRVAVALAATLLPSEGGASSAATSGGPR